MMIKIGIIGYSDGNGHPFSFSSIVNGYNNKGLKNSGWPVIYNYISARDESEFGFSDSAITHVWTQDRRISFQIANACRIPNIVDNPFELINLVDAVIIARDDYDNHISLSKQFLDDGLYVFIDKPLSLNTGELKYFRQYLEAGRLMSCSGLKYAMELDSIRSKVNSVGNIKLVRGSVIGSWEKYGIHMLDAVFSLTPFLVTKVLTVKKTDSHMSTIIFNNNTLIQIDTLYDSVKTFQLDVWAKNYRGSVEIVDNFSAFRRMLYRFITMIKTGKPPIDPKLTIGLMKVLIAANMSHSEGREVFLNEITI